MLATADITIEGERTGNVTVMGSLQGDVIVGVDDLDDDGRIVGDMHVLTDMSGILNVASDVLGDIDVDGNVAVGAALNIGGGLRGGRVMVDGLHDGLLSIDGATGTLSLIHLLGGLGSSGEVRINDSECKYNAKGDIRVGSTVTLPPLSPVALDGCIDVFDCDPNVCSACTGGGSLIGDVTVVGCHDAGDTLAICAEGGTVGSVTLVQSLRVPADATVDSSCPACA